MTPAWRGYRRKDFPHDAWRLEGGVLHAVAEAQPVSLVSVERYADFDLSFEWRLPAGGNSGVLYRVSEDEEAPWRSGPEMQLLGGGVPDGWVAETSCGALYGLYAPQNARPCATGAYNEARICARGSRVEHWLNGARVLACDLASEDFRARVARSKFRDAPRFARAAAGHLVLQHHGTQAWFRNVRIEAA